jgi:hypothetical protein
MLRLLTCTAFPFVLPNSLEGQARLPSPRGEAHTQVGGAYNANGQYQSGWWIMVDYGRPILRGRENMFGSGDTYGEAFLLGAPTCGLGTNQRR